jgi:hypothetical protein
MHHEEVLGRERYVKLFRSFKALSANRNLDAQNEGHFYLTEKSFRENFLLVFGHTNDLMRDRVLDLIFGNTCEPCVIKTDIPRAQVRSQSVTFMQFLQRVTPLFLGTLRE